MLMRWQNAIFMGVVLLLIAAWESSAIPHYVSECPYQYETFEKHCTDINAVLFSLGKSAEILERYAGAITAIFTVVLGISTILLWRVTAKSAGIAERALTDL